MSKIVSIGTAVPEYRHSQQDILPFMQRVYALNEADKRKMKFLYGQSGIETRYSVLPDYGLAAGDWQFYPATENLEPFPGLEQRMKWYDKEAARLSVKAINNCIDGKIDKQEITHLITVSCTGMSAPGLDLQIIEQMDLPVNTFRTSVNFMGCYAAIHALKLANALCVEDNKANVIVVCTELCTLHFQKESSLDNIASSLLFSDGSAAALVSNKDSSYGLTINSFYSEVISRGKQHMSWQLSSFGFIMKLSSYLPDLIGEDFDLFVTNALTSAGLNKSQVSHWCIHPGGKKILSSIQKSINIAENDLRHSYDTLRDFGNMSSPTILFVLKNIMEEIRQSKPVDSKIFGAAFGPGLTMETFILTND